jgi:hypothetical protein
VVGRSYDFNYIANFQFIFKGNQFAVNLGANTPVADIGMDTIGEIDGRRILGKTLYITIRGNT